MPTRRTLQRGTGLDRPSVISLAATDGDSLAGLVCQAKGLNHLGDSFQVRFNDGHIDLQVQLFDDGEGPLATQRRDNLTAGLAKTTPRYAELLTPGLAGNSVAIAPNDLTP